MALSPRLVLALLFVVNCVLWSQSRYAQFGNSAEIAQSQSRPLKRGLAGLVEAYYQDEGGQVRLALLKVLYCN